MNNSMSWLLGFLTTDGYFCYPKYRKKGDERHFGFCIHYKDAEVLYKIKDILQTKANVRVYPDYKSPQASMAIYDRKDIIDLYHNIKNSIPQGIVVKHYLRGLIDGDGCLNYRSNRKSVRINLTNASYNVVNFFAKIVSDKFDIPYKTPIFKTCDNLYIIEWEGKIAKLIAWWLYHGNISECVLKRKLDYYVNFVLCDHSAHNRNDELLVAIGNDGEYKLHKHNDGIAVSLLTDSSKSLEWAKRISKLIPHSTPIPVNAGQNKYYSLYIPVINTQSIKVKIDEDIVQ